MPGLEPLDWTKEMYKLEDYDEKPSKKPLIVSPEEADIKYTDPKVLARVLHYLDLRAADQGNMINELNKTLDELKEKILDVEIKVTELTPSKRTHTPSEKAMLLNKVSRNKWDALPPKSLEDMENISLPIKKVHITYGTETETSEVPDKCAMIVKEIQERDMTNGMLDIAYNFLIAEDGQVYEGRGWYLKPELSSTNPEFQDETIDIAYVGKYTKDDYPEDMLHFTKDLLQFGIERDFVAKDYKLI